MDDVIEDDMKDYDDRLEPGDIQAELEKWKAYIDTDNVTDGQWRKKYRQYLKADPIERTQEWEDIYYDIEMETDRETDPDFPRGMGFCFMYWSTKKAVLARRGIRWRSPDEMNPNVIFD